MTNQNKKYRLFRLIKSLTINEKRYVVIYLSKHKKDNNLLKLYKAISKSPAVADDDSLKKDIKRSSDKKFISQFAKNKHALYILILDALHQFHLRKSPYARILTMLHQAEILSNKRLADEHSDLLLKAGRMADEYELFELKLEILKAGTSFVVRPQISKRVMKEIEDLSDKIVQHSKLIHLTQRIVDFTRIAGNRLTLNQVSYLRKQGLEELNKLHLNLNSCYIKYSYLDHLLMYYTVTGKHYESYINGMKILKLVKQNPSMLNFQLWRDKYGSSLNRLLNASAMVGKYKLAELVYNEINGLDIAEHRKILVELNILDIYIQSGEFKMGERYLNSIQKSVMHVTRSFDPYTISVLYFNLALMNFGLGYYLKAISWFNEIIGNSGKFIPDRYFGAVTLILRLITYYELRQYDIIESLLRSTQQYIMKQEFSFKFDQLMLKYIRQITTITSMNEFIAITKRVRTELLMLSKNKAEAKILNYFDFISWLDSKIENKPFPEILKRKNLKIENS